ncbi:MAG: hypothetical protein WC634_01360 [archaeon]
MEPEVLVSEQDIIATYSEEEQLSCRQYAEYQKIIQENPSFGYKRCAKLLGVSQGRTRWWHTKGTKKAVPIALKTIEKLKSAGFIPFTEKHEHAKTIFNILGTLFGDGGIDKRLNTIAFISSDKRDVDLWEQDLLKVFFFSKNKTSLVEGGEWGHSYNIRTFDRNIIRFFVALGTPVGNKVTTKYSLPQWLFSASEKSRFAFLDGYLASEVSVPHWKTGISGNCFFADLAMGISKVLSLEAEHIAFLKDVEKLLHSVGIATTGNIYKNLSAGRLRKDGFQTANYKIFPRTTFHRALFFNENFPFRYATGKKQRMKAEIEKALECKRLKRSI